MQLRQAYFGIMRPDFNANDELKPANLFGSVRVLHAVAVYKTMSPARRNEVPDPVAFCFGDTRGRVQYEWNVGSIIFSKGTSRKVDVYTMYVLPNKKLLMDIVDKISVNSCKKFLREDRTRRLRV